MDALIELLPLLFVAAYYLLGARRRAAQQREAHKQAKAPQRELISDEPREASPFESFLTQLEEAMAEANGITPTPEERKSGGILDDDILPEPEPLPVVPAAPPVTRPQVSLGPEFKPVAGSFDSLAPTIHEKHGFGSENPLSEETFEQSGSSTRRSARLKAYDPHGLRPRPIPAPSDSLFSRLHDPKTARDAFVLQTIFGPRGGRRGDRR